MNKHVFQWLLMIIIFIIQMIPINDETIRSTMIIFYQNDFNEWWSNNKSILNILIYQNNHDFEWNNSMNHQIF